ncbi:sensor domain-containing diguanylate cyclase [Neorhizobium sp. NCHU2750]|uniref:sensor domain-containing diguanylate cyclase n=1 Tax=Neorhizobium sp. NCHU2750 TaxID=1825976 RepID=UPI000E71C376|nr:diguanylate cyclase [Neorhizobium sp. NCHU2750]
MALAVQLPQNEAERLLSVRSLIAPDGYSTPELTSLVQLAKDVFDSPVAAVNVVDEDWQRVACQVGTIEISACSRDVSICSRVVFANEVVVIPDLSRHPELRHMPYVTGEPHFLSYAGAPVSIEPDMPVGSFCLIDTRPRDFSDGEIRNLRQFADVASGLLRLQKAKFVMEFAEEKLKLAAMTDPLTGFYNRSALVSLIDVMLNNALSQHQGFGVLYLDMDGFKAINDRYGHHTGDEVLTYAAKRISECIRAQDVVVRMGGDEFAIFVPDPPDITALSDLSERLLGEFRRPFVAEEKILNARLSIGAALAPNAGSERLSLLKAVDEALYQAKEAGRDRFVLLQS